MKESEVKAICAAAMLTFDPLMTESLTVIEGMMEEVAQSALSATGNGTPRTADAPRLRPDGAVCGFTRDELLSGCKRRQGEFIAVPRVIKG